LLLVSNFPGGTKGMMFITKKILGGGKTIFLKMIGSKKSYLPF
jgi:hypothetical protein